jgi:ATP-binding cassette subfamily F protein 3
MKAERKKAQEMANERIPAPIIPQNTPPKNEYYRSKDERAAETRKRTRIKKIEEEISALETEEAQLNASLSDPDVTANFALLTEKCNRLEVIKDTLEKLYNEYEQLI